MHPIFSLTGQTVLVTGAGSAEGIGFATAKLLAEMGAEVAVAATGQRIQQRVAELRQAGHTARWYVADLTDRLTWLNITLASGTALIGVAALSVATSGYLRGPITWLEQLAYFVVAVLLIHPSLTLSAFGLGVGGILVTFHLLTHSRGTAVARTPST